MTVIGLAIFGTLGVLSRYYIDKHFEYATPTIFPWHTFTINVLGSFLIGVIYILASERTLISEPWRLILTTGFLGAFTTFSAFSIQNFLLIEDGRLGLAVIYSSTSVIAAIFGTWIGVTITRLILVRFT